MAGSRLTAVLGACVACLGILAAADQASPAADQAPPADEVFLKDGTVLKGELVTMDGGSLTLKSASAGEVKVPWDQVSGLVTGKARRFVLADGTELRGMLGRGEGGTFVLKSELLAQPAPVPLGSIASIDPPDKKAITFKGNLNGALSISDGNTNTTTASFLGEFEARSERQRLTIGGAYNYAEDEDGITARNARGRIKYDFFITKRFYAYANAYFEGDTFQDLNLRSTLGVGPGYQFIDSGDFEDPYFAKMQLLGEAGLSYVSEDFKIAEDQQYVAVRWSVKFDWPITPLGLTAFHYHEGYPSLEDAEDFYIATEQGVRFQVWRDVNVGVQVNYRYDSSPSPGFERGDALYLLTVGYNFNL